MSFYFREKPRFGDKLRGKPRDELLQELKQQFDENSKSFFEPAATRVSRDPFERHTSFSRGFPFDDVEGFGRRSSDIRSHLDDLASRHPDLADHLLGPPWGDLTKFHTGSLRNRRRGSGGSSSHQGHPDEDARSQASGSSGTSAASGASGVSSQGEPSISKHRTSNVSSKHQQEELPNTRRIPVPQYGLRNTVDIGQHRHNMENPEKGNRGQRSMSAPPENRQQDENPNAQDPNSQQSQNPNQRFVSRVDITPQFPQQQQSGGEKTKSQQPQSQQQPQKSQHQQGNVRHIPIFVEGRDEPVIPKNVDQVDHEPSSWSYAKPQPQIPPQFQQPPQFQSPPQFHRTSPFNQHYGRARDWLPDFEEEFYSPPQATFQQPGPRRTQQHQQFRSQSPPQQSHFRQPQTESKRQQERPFYPQQTHDQQQQPQQPEEPPTQPRKQTQPKDPLEKVAEVQKEVDALTEQVHLWNGTSRKNKQYMYLDEMLTRELIKLDDIETEGKENVRQARKNAIKSIQDSISLLESKSPLPEQLQQQQTMELDETPAVITNSENSNTEENKEDKIESGQQGNDQQAIPLPPAPASPTKEPTVPINQNAQQPWIQESRNPVGEEQNTAGQENTARAVPMESAPVEKIASVGSMEVQAASETEQTQTPEQQSTVAAPQAEIPTENQAKSPKVAKKVKKTKKQPSQQQTPICDGAIPLPAPEICQTETAM